jgi:hypothetical protein
MDLMVARIRYRSGEEEQRGTFGIVERAKPTTPQPVKR